MNDKGKSTLEVMRKTLRRRNYSEQTIRTYCSYANKFLLGFNKDAYHISSKEAKYYLESYNYTSVSQQNQIINSIKFLYRDVVGSKLRDLKITRPRKEKKLPRIIDSDKIIEAINSIDNKKHKAIIQLAFGTGMRVSEVINLLLSDIDYDRMMVFIRNSKGRKDRIVPISDKTKQVLEDYIAKYNPKKYLFNGQKSLTYSRTSCGKVVKKYLGEDKHFHLIRHSYATNLVENGVNTLTLQRLLGHSSPVTSRVHTHLSSNSFKNIKLPC